jgi:hypothetical protein
VESNLPTYRKIAQARPQYFAAIHSIAIASHTPASSPSRRLRCGMQLHPTAEDPQVHHLYAFVCKRWAIEPELFRLNPLQKMPD